MHQAARIAVFLLGTQTNHQARGAALVVDRPEQIKERAASE